MMTPIPLLPLPLRRRIRHAGAAALAAVALTCSVMGHAALVQIEVQDDAGRPLPDAVVYLESAEARAAVKPAVGAEIEQVARQFMPQVTVITVGSEVRFPNRDRFRHQVYSFSPAKKFELKLYAGTEAQPVVFDRPGVVVLGCNIHDDMVGWVMVIDTPYHGRSDAAGTSRIDNVAPGTYRLRAWHRTLPAGVAPLEQALSVTAAGAKAIVRLVGARP